MNIKNIYLGTIPILRLIQNGKILWENARKIPIESIIVIQTDAEGLTSKYALSSTLGKAVNKAYASGVFGEYPMFGIHGESDNHPDTKGIFTIVLILPTSGTSQNYINSPGSAYAYRMLSMNNAADEVEFGFHDDCKVTIYTLVKGMSSADTEMNIQGSIQIYNFALGESEIKIHLDFPGQGLTHDAVYSRGKATAKTKTFSSLCPFPWVGFHGVFESDTFGKALTQMLEASVVATQTFNESDGVGTFNIHDIFRMLGISENPTIETEGAAILRDSVVMRGDIDHYTYTDSLTTLLGMAVGKSNVTIAQRTRGKLSLLYLPFQEGDTLYIPSAHGATVSGGVLSIT